MYKKWIVVCALILSMHSDARTDTISLPHYCKIPFQKAHTRQINAEDPQWQLVKTLYKEFANQKEVCTTTRIPKIIHQIWLGSPVPARYARLQKTFQDNHPEWEYRLWTDADIAALNLENNAAYTASTNWGEKSDIARYEILYRFGGLYADLDVECIDNFDALHALCDFYAGLSMLSDNVLLENCVIGCAPGHPIMQECIKKLAKKESAIGYWGDTIQGTGPGHLTQCFLDVVQTEACADLISIALPSFYFFSPDVFSTHAINRIPFLAIHYWEGSWMEREHRWHHKGWEDYGTRFQ